MPAEQSSVDQIVSPQLRERMVTWRRHIHQHPELARNEVATSQYVRDQLDEIGIPWVANVGGHGIVATLTRGENERAVGLRADMDGLPIEEKTNLPYASRNEGVMHACGHDGHTASLLGGAALLAADPDWTGTVHFIFQPAEEGGIGAKEMIADGIVDRFPCDSYYAFHNWPGLPAGTIAVKPGGMMAAGSGLRFTLTGKAAHAATPHHGRDPVVAAAALIMGLQTAVSRSADPLDAGVVSVTMVNAGTIFNQIPETVELVGTMRSMSEEVRDQMETAIRRVAQGVETSYGVGVEIAIRHGAGVVSNTKPEARIAARSAEAIGADLEADPKSSMISEDFGWFMKHRPGAFAWIGNGPFSEGDSLHSPHYRFNEAVLPVAAAWFWQVAKSALAAD